jgi:small redox-active disulfide protein 2
MLNIKVLGTGCPNCKKLESMCAEIIAENRIDAVIEKITDIKEIMSSGIMITPGLIINGKIVSSGKIPLKPTLLRWIMNALAEED